MELHGLRLPLIKEGDDIPRLILTSIKQQELELDDGDILVVTEKIVAKAQGKTIDLNSVTPSKRAVELGASVMKDPRLVELVLKESKRVLRVSEGVLIVETKEGLVCANAGIDSSNVEDGKVKLLPEDPDQTAEHIRKVLEKETLKKLGIIISDSFGRPFRSGSIGVAIGASNVSALWDRRGEKDLMGRTLESTRVAAGDCIASAASLVTGEAAEGIPVVMIKGLGHLLGEGKAQKLIRPASEDLFRK